MKRMMLIVMAVAAICVTATVAADAGQDDPSVLKKYASKLKWFHTQANPGEKIEVIEAAMIAAKAGIADAQLYLAYAYIDGVGVPRDREKGMELLREAARNGSEDARAALKELEEELRAPAPDVLPPPVPDMPETGPDMPQTAPEPEAVP